MDCTKGKWIARIYNHSIDVIEEKSGFGICDIGTYDELKFAEYPINQAKENAKLIAKAPEMYETLRAVRLSLGMIEHNWDYRTKDFMAKVIEVLKELE